jgi:hypothetical protein
MFSVVFEVHPKPEQWDAYLGNAKSSDLNLNESMALRTTPDIRA